MQIRREVVRSAAAVPTPVAHLDARAAQPGEAPARDPFVGIADGDDDPGDAGLDQRLGARRRVAVVVARFERAVRGARRGRGRRRRAAPRPRRAGPSGTVPVAPSPTISPSRTMTHPTAGQGAV